MPYIIGTYIWTGFDYLGEPSPHVFPSVSSFFGMMDTCGFEKGGYYIAKALWSSEPYIHFLPDNEYTDGETVRFMSCTNCEEAELFINGVSKGRQKTELYTQVFWEIPWESGVIKISGYNNATEVCCYEKSTHGKFAALEFKPFYECFDNEHTAIPIEIYAADEKGILDSSAQHTVKITVSGGKLIGTGNGDPNCHESFVTSKRSLFAGRAMAIISANENAENVLVKAKIEGMPQFRVTIPVKSHSDIPKIPTAQVKKD